MPIIGMVGLKKPPSGNARHHGKKKAFPYLQESPWKKKVIVSLCVLMDFSNPDSIILVVKQVAGSNQSKVHDNT